MKQKGSITSAQHASEKVPDPTGINSNIKGASAHFEQKPIHFIQILMIFRAELAT